jgi:hypothetical protein
MRASVVLTPPMSKRLIAKGVAALPQVVAALDRGRIVITLGTTNAYVAEELLGGPIDRGAFAAGFIDDRWNINARLGEVGEIVLDHGIPLETGPEETLASLAAGDVVIKGGNALDPEGVVGVLIGSSTGGTVGRYIATCLARGVEIVAPISLSKSVHTSIIELSHEMGIGRTELWMGLPCGIFPLHGDAVTEIDALEGLFPVRALHVSSGGIGLGAGAVSLLIEGEGSVVRNAFALVESLRDEADIELSGRK